MKTNGCISSRRKIMDKGKEKFINKLLFLSSPVISAIIIFKEATSKTYKKGKIWIMKQKEFPKK